MKQLSWKEIDTIIQSARSDRKKLAALIDIDSTIMDTAARNLQILREAAPLIREITDIAQQLSIEDMGYNLADDIERKQLVPLHAEVRSRLMAFWRERFFTNEYLLLDHPYPGAREFVWKLMERDLDIVYLTGRDEPGMREGTLASFRKHKLPVDRGTSFYFKPDFQTPDLDFKKSAFNQIQRDKHIILAIENEPTNANAMLKAFPDASILLIDSICSPHAEQPHPNLLRFDRYPTVE